MRRRTRLAALLVLAAAFTIASRLRAQSSDAAAPASGGAEAPVEVTVRGPKPLRGDSIGADDLRVQDARAVPGTFGDPFQAVAALPGVAATASGLPYFYVRGAPPADTGYFLDGVPLPALYHVGPGPSYVHPALVDRIDFFPSAAPARFGRFAGGVIAGTLAPPAATARAEGSVRMFDASALVETPVDADTTVLAGGRYGYPDLLLSLFAPGLSLGYGDYTTRIVRRLGPSDAISLFAIGGYDTLQDSSAQLPTVDTQFHRTDVRYDHRWSSGSLRVAGTFGYDRSSRPLGATDADGTEIARATSGRWRLELAQRLGADARLSAGADAVTTHYAYDFTGPGAVTVPDTEQVFGAYADLGWRPAARVELAPGVRLDAYRTAGGVTTSLEPRLASRIEASRDLTWVSTFGVARQEPAYVIPVPGLRIDPSGGLQSVYQIAEGADVRLPWNLRAKTTAFFHADRGMSDYVSDCGSLAVSCSEVARVDGRTYGVELLVRRPFTERFAGWIAYTLSRAERAVGSAQYLSPFDRTHVLSGVASYELREHGIRAGVRATYYSGRPDFPEFFVGAQSSQFAFGPGQLAQHRLPSFFRIDVNAAKRWKIGKDEWIAVVLDFFDATLSREAVGWKCDLASGVCTARYVGPIALPSLGVDGGF